MRLPTFPIDYHRMDLGAFSRCLPITGGISTYRYLLFPGSVKISFQRPTDNYSKVRPDPHHHRGRFSPYLFHTRRILPRLYQVLSRISFSTLKFQCEDYSSSSIEFYPFRMASVISTDFPEATCHTSVPVSPSTFLISIPRGQIPGSFSKTASAVFPASIFTLTGTLLRIYPFGAGGSSLT